METNNPENEKIEICNSQTVETENEVKGDDANVISYGKFKDLTSLLKSYENLEAEFTRRSQRLKELEGEILRIKQ
ncbi:MAG: hypothetical protein MJ072_04905 [Clostridia bacterium]|nr:hypothetical protein [Clostridia bacterium]